MLKLAAWALAVTFPSTERLPGLDKLDPRPFLLRFAAETPFAVRAAFYVSVLVFVLTPLLTIGLPLPAFLLPKARLDRHAQKLATHPVYLLRQTMMMVKTVGGLVWGAHPEVRATFAMAPYPPDPGTWRAN